MDAYYTLLDDPGVFRVNQLKACSDHICYGSPGDYESDSRNLYYSLSGEWQFHYASDPSGRPKDIWSEEEFSDTIPVPGHIELAGYGQIQYINTLYPWEGHVWRRPPYTLGQKEIQADFAIAKDNPVGTYRRKFALPPHFRGKRIRICFEGAEQAMYLWLNGAFIGYATDSFSPSWFDLTPYIQEENVLVVQLFKRSAAAYLEDQDFFRFFGLFRDVKLFAVPDIHIEDIWARPILNEEFTEGTLHISMQLSGTAQNEFQNGEKLICELKSPDGENMWEEEYPLDLLSGISQDATYETGRLDLTSPVFKNPSLWDAHHPTLYHLLLTLVNNEGEIVEMVPLSVGFRRIEIRDGIIRLNGRRLILCGVNRHEWNPTSGRSISREDMETDIQILKRNHINAVRTCHYMDHLHWYDLCDENGIYLCAEANLESHGSWQKANRLEPSWNVPGDLKQWEAIVLDRVRTLFETLKNHVSILMWSLGNESYAGECIASMYAYLHRMDSSRIIHYEGCVWRPDYMEKCTDVYSRMYASPAEMEKYLKSNPRMPAILCEYMHSMGNSVGGMGTYMELLDRYDQFQGGFIWDMIDQALYRTDPATGKKVLGYGGDFDDRPSNYEFSGNGLLFADRSEKPAMQEVKYYYGRYA